MGQKINVLKLALSGWSLTDIKELVEINKTIEQTGQDEQEGQKGQTRQEGQEGQTGQEVQTEQEVQEGQTEQEVQEGQTGQEGQNGQEDEIEKLKKQLANLQKANTRKNIETKQEETLEDLFRSFM